EAAPSADHRGHRQGDEGRPREDDRGGRLGLSLQAGGFVSDARRHASLAAALRNGAGQVVETSTTTPAVLVVDDNVAQRAALRAVLEDLGVTIVEAESGRDALRCLLRQPFAVV